jgi:hypothetical protein
MKLQAIMRKLARRLNKTARWLRIKAAGMSKAGKPFEDMPQEEFDVAAALSSMGQFIEPTYVPYRFEGADDQEKPVSILDGPCQIDGLDTCIDCYYFGEEDCRKQKTSGLLSAALSAGGELLDG